MFGFRKRNRCRKCPRAGQAPAKTVSLAEVKRGQCCRIVNVPAGKIRAQALRFGIAEGEIVICREKIPAGPVVIARNRQEIAVGRGLARQIQVQQI